MSRVVHVSTVVGDDELGDGSKDCPVATLERADEISCYGDVIAYDGLLGSMVPVPDEAPSPRTTTTRVLVASLLGWAYLVLVGLALVKNPGLAVLLVAVPAVLAVCVLPDRKQADR